MTKLKKFRFLFKCFGLIGAICISLGFLYLKNVNAFEVVNDNDYDYSDYVPDFNNVHDSTSLFQISRIDKYNQIYNTFVNNYDYITSRDDNGKYSKFINSIQDKTFININTMNLDNYIFIKNSSNYGGLHISIDSFANPNYLSMYINSNTDYVEFYNNLIDFPLNNFEVDNNDTWYCFEISASSDLQSLFNKFGYQASFSVNSNVYNYNLESTWRMQVSIDRNFNNLSDITGFQIYCFNSLELQVFYDLINFDTEPVYDLGFNKGYISGKYDAINNDYHGKTYQQIYDLGEIDTISTDYQGKTYQQIYDSAYNTGYNTGQASVSNTNVVVGGLFGSIANVPLTILNGLFPATILGVPIITVLLTFLSILVIVWLIKRLI